ncbi:MAG: hypothetical protein M1818_000182 [Claussenomyces sp. TS43310]|nr:MAG: hypothetical protein M1818_000182 [Claussenomyces sp. TS43310]
MTYQGGPGPGPGNGYDPRYARPQAYNAQAPHHARNNDYDMTINTQSPSMGMPHLQSIQPQLHTAYYPQPQYLTGAFAAPQGSYYQGNPAPPQLQYPHYADHHQQQPILQYRAPSVPSYQTPVPQSPQQMPQPARQAPSGPRSPQTPASAVMSHTSHKLMQSSTSQIEGTLLITLAEEYFSAARNLGVDAIQNNSTVFMESYQKLIATGLGCLETCLQNCILSPRLEARIRYRFAAVMFEETENPMETELTLTKGIAVCTQHRYPDLRYNMQFLLARSMFRTSPKAALKALDLNILEAEAYKHHSWVYAFRFLRASLSLALNTVSETHAAVQNLRSIASIASTCNDRAILVTSSLIEAMAHLSSPSPESREHLQRSLAAAWTYQLDEVHRIPQIVCFLHFLDVASTFLYDTPKQALPKVRAMQVMMDQTKDDAIWNDAGDVVAIPITVGNDPAKLATHDTRGVLDVSEDGRHMLMMSVLTRTDAMAFTCLLSAIVMLHKDCDETHKSSTFLQHALTSLKLSRKSNTAKGGPSAVKKSMSWRANILSYCHVYQFFCFAIRTEWRAAKDALQKLNEAMPGLDGIDKAMMTFISMYLSGIYFQGTGELDLALQVFRDPEFRLGNAQRSSPLIKDQFKHDISLLAALNIIFIMQEAPRKDPTRTFEMISELEPFCPNHPNRDIRTAFDLVKATFDTNPVTSSIKARNHLRAALECAQSASNQQFSCIVLNVMCSKYFSGVVGQQAEKSAYVGVVQARNAGNLLWQSVGNGLLAQTLETQGKMDEAQRAMFDARRLAAVALSGPQ